MVGRMKARVVVIGAGVAGSLITAGLMGRDDINLACIERVGPGDQAEAGTGLNIGPNAIKCLRDHLPQSAETILANSLPWRSWQVFLTDGRPLINLDLASVADNAGIRIRWAELYALLRKPIAQCVRFSSELVACGRANGRPYVVWKNHVSGKEERIDCHFSWNRDPATGLIFIQSGPRGVGSTLAFRDSGRPGLECWLWRRSPKYAAPISRWASR